MIELLSHEPSQFGTSSIEKPYDRKLKTRDISILISIAMNVAVTFGACCLGIATYFIVKLLMYKLYYVTFRKAIFYDIL